MNQDIIHKIEELIDEFMEKNYSIDKSKVLIEFMTFVRDKYDWL